MIRRVRLHRGVGALVVSVVHALGCGDEDLPPASACWRLAEVVCGREVACGEGTDEQHCVAQRASECAFSCGVGEMRSEADLDACRAEHEQQACGEAGTTVAELCPMAACVSDERGIDQEFFRDYDPLLRGPCDPSRPFPLVGASVRLELLRGRRIDDKAVQTHSRFLGRYYDNFDLRFSTSALPRAADLDSAFSGSIEELEAALVAEGFALDEEITNPEDEARVTRIVTDVMFRDLRAFLRREAIPAMPRVLIVIVREIVPRALQPLFGDTRLAGLGLSPALLDRIAADDPELSLRRSLDLEADFTPTLFVGHEAVTNNLAVGDTVVAHEMGHALGLGHVDDRDNLMFATIDGRQCIRHLTDDQVASLVGLMTAARAAAPEPQVRVLARAIAAVPRVLQRSRR